jgi:hypothetical protein
LRVKNVWAYVKTGALYAAAFGLLIFGLGLIGPQEEGDEYGGPRHSIAETLSPIMTRACEG